MRKDNRNTLITLMLPIALVAIGGFFSCSRNHNSISDPELASLFEEIDREIDRAGIYQEEKEKRIELLRNQFINEEDLWKKSSIADRLITEYESFNSDSALNYVNIALSYPDAKEDNPRRWNLLIRKADITAHAGLFGEAASILKEINSSKLDSANLESYYAAYCDLYQYQTEYATDGEYARLNEKLREDYIDSISRVSSPESLHYLINKAAAEARDGRPEMAEKMLLQRISDFKSGDRNYSIISSILADISLQKKDELNYKKYLAQSVISDIRGSIKENMALRALATACYEDGNIERADLYLLQSFTDANFFAARMRNAQSSRMLPVIGETYKTQQKELHSTLRGFIIAVSILAACLVVILIFSLAQFLKVKKANRNAEKMLKEVSSLSEQLKKKNEEVSNANDELKRSNSIKEEYAGLFMEYCSLAISSLQQYHQGLRVLVAQGNTKSLLKKIDSTEMEEKTLKEFYQKFDEAILHIYPDFVDKVNILLLPEQRIILKPGEALNTELRLCALIRIGISDPEKIARFLRCSLSTIYTYRSKLKKRAIDPQEFENRVRDIE